MLRRTFCTLSAAVILAAAPHFASAADEPAVKPEHATLFKSLDKDGDGKIGIDEVPQEQRRLLERLLTNHDKNKDGKLTVDEFSAGLSEGRPQGDPGARRPEGGPPGQPRFNPEEMFKRLDADGDGKVKPEDVPEDRREFFRRLIERADENKDGAASLEEFRKGFALLQPQPGTPPQPGQPGPNSMEMVFKTLDADGNGSLSKEELSKAAEALAKLDKNGDGSVSREEAMPRPGQPGRPQPGQPGRPNPAEFLGLVMRQDRDGDKMISKEEAGDRLKENFDRIDRNSDGKLDETELKQMIERMQQGAGTPPGRRPEGAPKPEGDKKPETRRPDGEKKPDGDRKPKSDDAPKKE